VLCTSGHVRQAAGRHRRAEESDGEEEADGAEVVKPREWLAPCPFGRRNAAAFEGELVCIIAGSCGATA
jgi:hypothetical protein